MWMTREADASSSRWTRLLRRIAKLGTCGALTRAAHPSVPQCATERSGEFALREPMDPAELEPEVADALEDPVQRRLVRHPSPKVRLLRFGRGHLEALERAGDTRADPSPYHELVLGSTRAHDGAAGHRRRRESRTSVVMAGLSRWTR